MIFSPLVHKFKQYSCNTDIPCGPMQRSGLQVTSNLVNTGSLGDKIPRTVYSRYYRSITTHHLCCACTPSHQHLHPQTCYTRLL